MHPSSGRGSSADSWDTAPLGAVAAGISLFPSWPWLVAGPRAPLPVVPLSCEAAKAPIPEPVSPELQRRVESLSETIQLVLDLVAKFKGKALLAPCCASPGLGWQQEILTAWGSGAKRHLQMGTTPEMGFAGAWAPRRACCADGEQQRCQRRGTHASSFPSTVNLRSDIDRERGKFLKLMATSERENLPRVSFLISLVQREAHTTSKPGNCLELSPIVLNRPAVKIQVCPRARQHQGRCPATPGEHEATSGCAQ